jgi:DNA-binding NtrC family response regulator
MDDQANARLVLVVEDDSAHLALLCRILRRSGFASRGATSIGEADAALKEQPYRAVLLDYRLGAVDSWPLFDACQELSPQPPVVMITAMGDERVAAEALQRGAAEYVIKAEGYLDQLPQRVARVIKLVEERREIEAKLRYSERMASLGTLAAGIAHEINNPLAYVVGGLQLALGQLDVSAPAGRRSYSLDSQGTSCVLPSRRRFGRAHGRAQRD